MTVVSWLNSLHLPDHFSNLLLQGIFGWKVTLSYFTVPHIYREVNQVNDYLANKVLAANFTWDTHEIIDLPCMYLLHADAHGIIFHQCYHGHAMALVVCFLIGEYYISNQYLF